MHVFATFEHSTYIELAISELELRGIAKNSILTVPLEKQQQEVRILDTIHKADGASVLDRCMVLATIGSVLGTIYGFVLLWGPIIWGLIGMLLGFVVGLAVYWLGARRRVSIPAEMNRQGEVVLVIRCELRQAELVKKILQDHTAIGVGVWENSQGPRQGKPAKGGNNQTKPQLPGDGSKQGQPGGSGGQRPPQSGGGRQPVQGSGPANR